MKFRNLPKRKKVGEQLFIQTMPWMYFGKLKDTILLMVTVLKMMILYFDGVKIAMQIQQQICAIIEFLTIDFVNGASI